MIKIEDLKKIIKLVIITGDIRNIDVPVSLFIVGKSGFGKTSLITSFDKKTIDKITDVSYSGVVDILKENSAIKHIILPDFIKITEKKTSTANNLVSFLNALTDEGASKIRLYNTKIDLEGRKIGIITSTTKDSFAQNLKKWQNFGFVQRMLIVSYDYSDNTIKEIMEFINGDEFKKETEKIKTKKATIKIKSEKILNRQLNPFVNKNFRTLKHLQALVKSNALLNNRTITNQQDVDEIIRLTKYMNLNYTQI